MTLRTTAVIAGALGLLMLIAGLIAQAVRPAPDVVTEATLTTPVVVLGPELLALPELRRVAVTADGGVEAHAARPVDAEAWLVHHSATHITGYSTWEEFTTRTAARISAEPVDPSASPSPSPTAETAPAVASPSPSPAATAPIAEQESADYGSGDVWRNTWAGQGRVSLAVAAVGTGEYVIVKSVDGDNLSTIEISSDRQVNDAWISPLIWMGFALALLGLIALLSALVDIRPVQERLESWKSRRSRSATVERPEAGSRRERRLAASTLPQADVDTDGDNS